ncbi:MAG: hypothetical protein KF681_15985 [Bdellovibrionaceae bacterium]|nr:hypothetical protein [Pseudobdellovibrionaceae bacterium]
MKNFIALILLILAGCSSTKVLRNTSTDPATRVFVYGGTVSPGDVAQIQKALTLNGRSKFVVVDRGPGWEAAIREQDRQFRPGNDFERFSDAERLAHLGKMTGAAGVIVPSSSCWQAQSLFFGEYRKYCRQTLSFVNALDGRVEYSVEGENSVPWAIGRDPDWDQVTNALMENFPKEFNRPPVLEPLASHMLESEERAKRVRALNRAPATSEDQRQKDFDTLRRSAEEMKEGSTDENH